MYRRRQQLPNDNKSPMTLPRALDAELEYLAALLAENRVCLADLTEVRTALMEEMGREGFKIVGRVEGVGDHLEVIGEGFSENGAVGVLVVGESKIFFLDPSEAYMDQPCMSGIEAYGEKGLRSGGLIDVEYFPSFVFQSARVNGWYDASDGDVLQYGDCACDG